MNFDLRQHTCLLTIAGSRLYGIHTDQSDVDIKGVAIPPAEYYLGQKKFEQADAIEHMQTFMQDLTEEEQGISKKEKLEGTVYEIKKFISLATDNNPNILDVLFADDSQVRLITPLGRALRTNRDIFLSKKAYFTHHGYAYSQLKRIKTHRRWLLNPVEIKPTRADFDLPEHSLIPNDALSATFALINKKVDEWEVDLSCIPSEPDRIALLERIKHTIEEIIAGDEKWKRAGRFIGIDEHMLVLVDRERKYNSAMSDWKSYQNWVKTRNPKRAAMEAEFGYDLKHAAQLVRLMRTCKELLQTGKLNVNRAGIDAEEILAIKNGAWTYEQMEESFNKESAEIEMLYKTSTALPKTPNFKKIDDLCCRILSEHLKCA